MVRGEHDRQLRGPLRRNGTHRSPNRISGCPLGRRLPSIAARAASPPAPSRCVSLHMKTSLALATGDAVEGEDRRAIADLLHGRPAQVVTKLGMSGEHD